MSRLQRVSGAGKRDAEKYYIQCKNTIHTEAWLQQPDALDINQVRAIIQAVINDGVVRKNTKVVVKIGPSSTIKKEYQIGSLLKDVPGFIHFICMMSCHDNLLRYKVNKNAYVCSNDRNDALHNVLVMPHVSLGSIRAYPWHKKDISEFKSCMKQLFLSLYIAFIVHGFLHTYIHLDNVLLKRTRKSSIFYNEYEVAMHGIEICIMDFENAFIRVDTGQTYLFFKDIERIVYDLKLTMKMRVDSFPALETYLTSRTYASVPINIQELIGFIDNATIIEKEQVRLLSYDANVF